MISWAECIGFCDSRVEIPWCREPLPLKMRRLQYDGNRNDMSKRDLALTVLELEEAQFYWVVMEAVDADSEECLAYVPVDSATTAALDYSQSLIEGAAALRVLQGLAPFGKPPVAAGICVVSDDGERANERRPAELGSSALSDEDVGLSGAAKGAVGRASLPPAQR